MAVGTVLAGFPGRRRRVPTDPVSAPIELEPVRCLTSLRPSRRDRRSGRRAWRRSSRWPSPSVVAVLFVVLANGKAEKPDVTSSFLLNRPAPAAVSTTLDGKPFDLSRRKGSWVVLNFFQSTCLPCKAEHPELVAFAAQQAIDRRWRRAVHGDQGRPRSAVAQWFAEHGGFVADREGRRRRDRHRVRRGQGAGDLDHRSIRASSSVRHATTITADFLSTELQQLRQAYG